VFANRCIAKAFREERTPSAAPVVYLNEAPVPKRGSILLRPHHRRHKPSSHSHMGQAKAGRAATCELTEPQEPTRPPNPLPQSVELRSLTVRKRRFRVDEMRLLRLIPAVMVAAIPAVLLLSLPRPRRVPTTREEVVASYGEPPSGWRPVQVVGNVTAPAEYAIWPHAGLAGQTRIVWVNRDGLVTGITYCSSTAPYEKWFEQEEEHTAPLPPAKPPKD
jgi:hypothetical protein